MNIFDSIKQFYQKHISGSYEDPENYIPKEIEDELIRITIDHNDRSIEKDGWIYTAHNGCDHAHSQCEQVEYIGFSKRRK